MKIKHRAHLKSMTERIEIALIGALTALGADAVEVGVNILHDGFSCIHFMVFSFLVLGFILTFNSFMKHHASNFKEMLRELKIRRHQRRRRRLHTRIYKKQT